MAVTEGAIAHFAKRYQHATAKVPKRFVCPITLRDEPSAELCDGHILCDKLKSASKVTILQREDVDNRFGSLVERDFVTFANFRVAKPEEMLRAAKDLTITGPTGERIPAFFAGSEARVRFQQIEMYDADGKTIATPYLRSHTLDSGHHKQLQVEWMFYIHKYCFTAAMLKSAFLNLFRVFGYNWALDNSGDRVRRTLEACFMSADRKTALDQFADFEGCCWLAGNDQGDNAPDSLDDGRLLFHFTEGDAQSGLLFGISSVFWVNGALLAVTVPSCNRFGHYFVSWKYYQEFIKERQFCHNVHVGKLEDEVVRIDPAPLSLQKVDKLPPDNTVVSRLSPCPTSKIISTDLSVLLRTN
jgi:hypothetical protein